MIQQFRQIQNISSIVRSSRTYFTVRLAMSGVFLLAGISKLINFDIFVMIVEVYILDSPLPLPLSLLKPASFFIALLEVITGLGLLLDFPGFLNLLTGQLLFFIAVLIYGITIGLDVDCGCFILDNPDKPIHNGLYPALIRDLVMMSAVCYLYWWRWHTTKSCHTS